MSDKKYNTIMKVRSNIIGLNLCLSNKETKKNKFLVKELKTSKKMLELLLELLYKTK